MRMKPGPSSERDLSNKVQSTMSGFSSPKCNSPFPITSGMVPRVALPTSKRVNFALASALMAASGIRIARAAERQPQGNRAKLEVAAHGVQQIAPVAFGQLVGAVAEHDEGRRSRLHLGDVTELDALALGRGGRIGFDRRLEPAVELAGGDSPAPCLAQVESDLENGVDALAGLGRDGEQRHVL